MKEQGIITKIISGRLVEVAFQRSEACAKCRACLDLGQGMMGVEAVNEVGAKREDTVEIEIPSGEVVKGSILIFLFPLFFLIFGYLFGFTLAGIFGIRGREEAFAIVFALIFMGLSFLAINWYDKNIQQKEALRARIIKVISPR